MFTMVICGTVLDLYQSESMKSQKRVIYHLTAKEGTRTIHLSVFGPENLAREDDTVCWLADVRHRPDNRTRDENGKPTSYITNVNYVGEASGEIAHMIFHERQSEIMSLEVMGAKLPEKANSGQ